MLGGKLVWPKLLQPLADLSFLQTFPSGTESAHQLFRGGLRPVSTEDGEMDASALISRLVRIR